MTNISWQYFPKSETIPNHLVEVIDELKKIETKITSSKYHLNSDKVLSLLRDGLEKLDFIVEKSKKKKDKVPIPVLFGKNGKLEKSFEADAFNPNTKTIIEIEAGRGILNNQFLKDLFEACLMQNIDYLLIALRNHYLGNHDFETAITFFEALYASRRLILPLKGILIIGY